MTASQYPGDPDSQPTPPYRPFPEQQADDDLVTQLPAKRRRTRRRVPADEIQRRPRAPGITARSVLGSAP